MSGAPTIYLKDYKPFDFILTKTELHFTLAPKATRVRSKLFFDPNPETDTRDFFLHGEKLTFKSAKINGETVTPDLTEDGLRLVAPEGAFIFEAEVEIAPEDNTSLEGLYMSNGMYCTQCEAEGFRKITYYPDRPDVMAPFHVTIESDLPVLLSNGDKVAVKDGVAKWNDPWPKPAYLFALVAGELINHPDTFTTKSGREIELNIWVRKGDEDKCAFGMEALKASMKWDEDVYGREYDLDIFNIVAVDDFNMGAMENKGLNIFNSSCVLTSPETSTDANFERVEAIIAHEYFHNWTGNRITCRDWFQLCLKEGLTVFRDQKFTGDMRSHAVKRIDDVLELRARQFREDAGPLAHPVRPDRFREINNFYTATIYEKGAEIIGMIKTIVGDDAYDKALSLYFDRHDGDAATIEDWIKVFEDVTGRDLSQFKLWYSQAGTPRVKVSEAWSAGTYTLTLLQVLPDTPDGLQKTAQHIPVAVGLLSPEGEEVQETTVLELTETSQSFKFHDLAARPTASILRGFSAPVILEHRQTNEDRAFLMAHDTDPFNKWEAGRALGKSVLASMITKGTSPSSRYLDGLQTILRDERLDPAFRALALTQPSEDDMAQTLVEAGETPDPIRIHTTSEALKLAIAEHLQDDLDKAFAAQTITAPYKPDAAQSGARSLQAVLLGFISRLDGGDRAQQQFDSATNMTQQLGALSKLITIEKGDGALAAFYDQWKHERLVIDKWFALQTALAPFGRAADITSTLTTHADFNWKNPNRFRATIGGLAGNAAGFHDPSGASYDLIADWLIKLDAINPQTTARMTSVFSTWKRHDEDRQAKMRAAMERIRAQDGLSGDSAEMLDRLLNA